MRATGLAGLILAGACAFAAAAAPRDQPVRGGQTARLRIEVTQGGATPRSLILDLNVVSEETAPINMLADGGLTAGQQQAWDHRNQVLTESAPDPDEYARVWANFAAACDPAPRGPACVDATAQVGALQARLDAVAGQAEAKLTTGPAMDVDNHRFQKWGGDIDGGCGTGVARLGARSVELTHAAGQGADAKRLGICLTELVLDRRTGRAFVKFNPLVLAPTGEDGAFDLAALQRTAPNVHLEPGGHIGSPPHLILRELQPVGDLAAFTAAGRLPPRSGAPLEVRIQFQRTS